MGNDVETLQELIGRTPFLDWLGLEVMRVDQDGIDAKATWRPEWVGNPEVGQTQGGILAALVDFAADFALFAKLGRPVPTVDLRVDYHRLALKGDLFVTGRIVKHGRTISTCEASVVNEAGTLVASGRGTFLTAQGQKSS